MALYTSYKKTDLNSNVSSSECQYHNIPSQDPDSIQEASFISESPEIIKENEKLLPPSESNCHTSVANSSNEKENKSTNIVDVKPSSSDFPITPSLCDECLKKSSILGSFTDSSNWLAVLFQIVKFVISCTAFSIITALFVTSTVMITVLPIGLIFSWICSTLARSFIAVEIKLFSMIKSQVDNCTKCRVSPSMVAIIPDPVVKGDVKEGFLSSLYAPLKDPYTWLSIIYIISINPIMSLIGFLLSLIGLVIGLVNSPILPFVFKTIKEYSAFQRDFAIQFLGIEEREI
ncbi:hypothetical protein AYI68_g8020 [Smittium mucronatum]|uniref:Sensor domain-containing protein n=1 Tax=Smittium mucronatum TaxID=133383 RepID=A0A1R0GM27_9FUNG|nr:hypothetical protein AYI68_g8020 [Smittium mucronatum]